MAKIYEEKLLEVVHSFQKDKSPGPDGWLVEFYLDLFEFLGKDLHKVVEESIVEGFIHDTFNTTFIALIPKVEQPLSFEYFKLISLCNCICKIISRIIAKTDKVVLSKNLSVKQFGFLEGRQIHEVVGVAQEGIHILKVRNQKGVVIKIDLSKAYDRVN